VIRYAIASFCMGLTLDVLAEPLSSPLFSVLYNFSYIYVGIFMLMEFSWQRRLLITSLVKKNLSIMHTAFWPLYIKIAVYILIFSLMYVFDEARKVSGKMNEHIAFAIYFLIFAHAFVLLFCPQYIQRDLVLPILALLFFLSDNKERCYLVGFVVPQYHCLSNVLFSRLFSSSHASTTRRNIRLGDHFLPLSLLLMINAAYWNFHEMKFIFSIGDVAVYVPGIEDPPIYPYFSGFIMGYHKMGYFFLLAGYLTRLMNPCPPPLAPARFIGHKLADKEADSVRQQDSLMHYLWAFLLFFQMASAFFFHLGDYYFVTTKAFVWTMTVSIIVIAFGATIATSYIGDYVCLFAKYIVKKITKFRERLQSCNV